MPASRNGAQRLKGEIDRGLTRDKVAAIDPAAAPLGTNDEAAGHPVTARELQMSRVAERTDGVQGCEQRPWIVLGFYFLAIVVIGAVLLWGALGRGS